VRQTLLAEGWRKPAAQPSPVSDIEQQQSLQALADAALDEWQRMEGGDTEAKQEFDDLGVAVRQGSEGETPALNVYLRGDGEGVPRRSGDEAVQANAFHAAARQVACSASLRAVLSRLRAVALNRSSEDELFQAFSDAVVRDKALAVAIMSNEVSEPRGATAHTYLSKVVHAVRVIQAEILLAVTRELRDIMGYDAAVEDLARAICVGRWRALDFKSLAAPEAHGAWVGKEAQEMPEWGTHTGLFQSIWTPLVCVYTALHRYDASAHRVLTLVSAETQSAIRVGVTTANAVSGLPVKFFSMVEEEMRAMQRGSGRLVELRRVWEACQKKPFYQTYALQSAAGRMNGGLLTIDKLSRRLDLLENRRSGQGSGPAGGAGGAGGGTGAKPNGGGGNGGGGGAAKKKFIPTKELQEWQEANPGKCFLFHLKGACDGGASCPRGSH